MKKKILVLGGTGMLGAMVTEVLSREPDLEVSATNRPSSATFQPGEAIKWRKFEAWSELDECRAVIADTDYVINCIGITKPMIKEDDPNKVENAIRVNSLLPHYLAAAASEQKTKVIQIATDCVYSGATGNYVETSEHDALDVYGKTKSLGEVSSPSMHHLRVSIIGPEPRDHKFLLDWFLGQGKSASLNGFTNHEWNGVTTLHFARITLGVIRSGIKLPSRQHVVPSGRITKAALLRAFADSYGRDDIKINDVSAGTMIDRTLETSDHQLNAALWKEAGYSTPPTVEQMVDELAKFDASFAQRAVA